MANKNPTPPPVSGQFQPGESGNPAGRPPGIQNWSTLVRELLDDDALIDLVVSEKPTWVDKLPSKKAGHAVVAAMIINAIAGDTKAATWLRKTGYGDKLDIVSDNKRIKSVAIFDMRSGQEMALMPVPKPKPPRKPRAKKPAPKKPVAKKAPAKPAKKAVAKRGK